MAWRRGRASLGLVLYAAGVWQCAKEYLARNGTVVLPPSPVPDRILALVFFPELPWIMIALAFVTVACNERYRGPRHRLTFIVRESDSRHPDATGADDEVVMDPSQFVSVRVAVCPSERRVCTRLIADALPLCRR
jgi:hypothetical protein